MTRNMAALYTLLCLVILFLLATHQPIIGADTPSYIHFNGSRPPLYPLFIRLFKYCGSYQLNVLMWMRMILLIVTLFYLRTWLRRELQIADFLIFLLFCITIPTTFRFALLSETLTVPLFIMAFLASIDCMRDFQLKKVVLLAIWVMLLILTRTQFYYFYLFFVGLIFWGIWKKVDKKWVMQSALILFGSALVTMSINQGYQYFFTTIPTCQFSVANQLLIQPLYLADKDASRYFKDPVQKKRVADLLVQMKQQRLSHDSITRDPVYLPDLYYHYYANYNAMQDVSCIYLATLPYNEQQQFMLSVSKMLLLKEFQKNVGFFLFKWGEFMGSIPVSLALLIMLLAVSYGLFRSRITQPSIEQIFIFVGISLVILNNLLVALVESYVSRYFFYCYFIYYVFAVLAADRLLKHSFNNPNNSPI